MVACACSPSTRNAEAGGFASVAEESSCRKVKVDIDKGRDLTLISDLHIPLGDGLYMLGPGSGTISRCGLVRIGVSQFE